MYIKTIVNEVGTDYIKLKLLQNINDPNGELFGTKVDIRLSNKFKPGYQRVMILNEGSSIELKHGQIVHIGLSDMLSSRKISKYEKGWLFEINDNGDICVTGDNKSFIIRKYQHLSLALTLDDAQECIFKECV